MRPLGFNLGIRRKGPEQPPAYWGLCFSADEDGSTVAMEAAGSAPAVSLETSYDGNTWEPFYVGETSITLNKGECVYFKAGEGGNETFASSVSDYNRFVLSNGVISATGDMISLLNGKFVEDATLPNFCFCYLFYNCTALKTAPQISATTMGGSSCRYMYRGCVSLITAPELRAEKMSAYCYGSMFHDCISLEVAPELPAKTLAVYCYYSMFYGCRSLTVAPKLPATTLPAACYGGMFYGCRSLQVIDVAFTTWGTQTANWTSNTNATGEFRCPSALGTNETITRGASACPEGWTVINTD